MYYVCECEYEYICIALYIYICEYICISAFAHLSQKRAVQTVQHFLCQLSVPVAWSSAGSTAVSSVLPVLWLTSSCIFQRVAAGQCNSLAWMDSSAAGVWRDHLARCASCMAGCVPGGACVHIWLASTQEAKCIYLHLAF